MRYKASVLGAAAEAALLFPRNANLAATVAMTGLGFANTQVELVADPTLLGNSGRVIASSAVSCLDLTVSGSSMPDNPRTSTITAMSILSALDASQAVITFV
ncbi:DUF108 domain-containing protein [Phyllobacterium sp. LjRoot231]|uniref:aspartate dehydrogenase domain-containing protein n=1 Tax=Phyllobacterium sp. LjRoot231 TaxID=3342289 RepID=UPI003ECDDF2B